MLGVLLNPYMIVLAVVMLAYGIYKSWRAPVVLIVAAWGYGLTYHFSLGRQEAAISWGDLDQNFAQIGPVVIFILGVLVVSFLALYFLFMRD
ncbi:MAG: hypothetical protein M5R36_19955 [Deltaproteobacteria bacterium]|nr:hypothetical protein [Deltaproteobacteria bacterium]